MLERSASLCVFISKTLDAGRYNPNTWFLFDIEPISGIRSGQQYLKMKVIPVE